VKTNTVTLGADGHLTISMHGSLNFESARPIIIECKNHSPQSIRSIAVSLDGVTYIDSCGIGVISVLQDMVGVERFCLDLGSCAPLVRHLFESNVLDSFVSPSALCRCTACFETVKIDCKKPPLSATAFNRILKCQAKVELPHSPNPHRPTHNFNVQIDGKY
jgi:anti-anti-sigma regulatory factor